ncbi:MAG: hypothetical protein ACRDV3_08935 [Acidothermaceae bacterium]
MFGQVLDQIVSDVAGGRLLDHLVNVDELACSHSLMDAEARVRARVRLYRYLINEGWQPPQGVLSALERDEALLALPQRFRIAETTAGSGLSSPPRCP